MIDRFLAFEDSHSLFERKVGDFYFWPYIRFNLYMKMEEIKNNPDNTISNKPRKLELKDVISLIRNCTWRNPYFRMKNKDILIVNHPRRIKNGDNYECVYTEDIAKIFNDRACTLEFLYGWGHLMPNKTPNIFYMDYIDVFAAIQKVFIKNRYRQQIERLKCESIEIDKLLTEEFGFSTGDRYIFNLLEKRFYWYLIKKRMLKHVISKIKPKIVIETVGYETNKMIINEICNELNIPTVELQHGVMGRGHLAYNFLRKKEYAFFPDKIFVFSDYWKEVTRLPIKESDIINVGFPYLEKNLKKYSRSKEYNNRLNILIISQPEFSTKISGMAEELLRKLESMNIDFHIIYKLHPAEYNNGNDRFDIIAANKHVELINSNENSIYYYFAKSNVQIGVTSTAIFEGLAFNLDTFIYHLEKTDTYMKDLIEKGIAKMFDNADELIDMLLNIDLKSETSYGNSFWRFNSLENIINEIELITSKDN